MQSRIYRPVILSDMPDKHKYYTAQDQQRFLEGNTIEHMPSYQELTVECNVTWGNAGPPVVPAPTTLSRLLRLSRCMTSGRPVLIATYAGIEAASAAGVAAQLAGYHPLRFNCWNRLGEPNVVSQPGSGISLGAAEGAPPSEASLLALDSRYFMKRCILRAAGIKESYIDLPPSQAYRLRSSTVFETCPEERTVAIIAGLQEMPTTHRNDLLRFIGNDDPASFFTDYELIAIDLCLYETEVYTNHNPDHFPNNPHPYPDPDPHPHPKSIGEEGKGARTSPHACRHLSVCFSCQSE